MWFPRRRSVRTSAGWRIRCRVGGTSIEPLELVDELKDDMIKESGDEELLCEPEEEHCVDEGFCQRIFRRRVRNSNVATRKVGVRHVIFAEIGQRYARLPFEFRSLAVQLAHDIDS